MYSEVLTNPDSEIIGFRNANEKQGNLSSKEKILNVNLKGGSILDYILYIFHYTVKIVVQILFCDMVLYL